jgi:hypothetical protein
MSMDGSAEFTGKRGRVVIRALLALAAADSSQTTE